MTVHRAIQASSHIKIPPYLHCCRSIKHTALFPHQDLSLPPLLPVHQATQPSSHIKIPPYLHCCRSTKQHSPLPTSRSLPTSIVAGPTSNTALFPHQDPSLPPLLPVHQATQPLFSHQDPSLPPLLPVNQATQPSSHIKISPYLHCCRSIKHTALFPHQDLSLPPLLPVHQATLPSSHIKISPYLHCCRSIKHTALFPHQDLSLSPLLPVHQATLLSSHIKIPPYLHCCRSTKQHSPLPTSRSLPTSIVAGPSSNTALFPHQDPSLPPLLPVKQATQLSFHIKIPPYLHCCRSIKQHSPLPTSRSLPTSIVASQTSNTTLFPNQVCRSTKQHRPLPKSRYLPTVRGPSLLPP